MSINSTSADGDVSLRDAGGTPRRKARGGRLSLSEALLICGLVACVVVAGVGLYLYYQANERERAAREAAESALDAERAAKTAAIQQVGQLLTANSMLQSIFNGIDPGPDGNRNS